MQSSKSKQDSFRENNEKRIHNPEKRKKTKRQPSDFGFDSTRQMKQYERFLK